MLIGFTLIGISLIFPSIPQLSSAHITGALHLDKYSIVPGTILSGVIAFGLVHGLDPSHGWPVAILYSMRTKRPMFFGLLSSGIIAAAHFLSSLVVVAVYVFITNFIVIPQLYLRFGAALALGVLAYIFWKDDDDNNGDHNYVAKPQQLHGHETEINVAHEQSHLHQQKDQHHHHHHLHSHRGLDEKKAVRSLKGIAVFAFVLGFAHEEEFVILSLAVGGVDPVLLMISYATSVAVVLIGVTLLALRVYKHLQERIMKYTKYLPKITAGLLAAMAIGFATGLMTR